MPAPTAEAERIRMARRDPVPLLRRRAHWQFEQDGDRHGRHARRGGRKHRGKPEGDDRGGKIKTSPARIVGAVFGRGAR